jgi:hypothetical protein
VRRIALLAVTLALLAPQAGAQIISVPKGGLKHDPAVFAGASIGLFNLQDIFDGSTQTAWLFSQTIEYSGSLEFALSRGSAFGVTASYAHVPMLYVDTIRAAAGAPAGCCDAHTDVYTVNAQFSLGGGTPGFHQVVVVNAGIIAFENFTADNGGQRLPPDRNIDPRLAIGYGFGYGFGGGRNEAFIVQEYGVALHESKGLSGNDRRQYQQQTTRLGVKFGLGGR